MKLAANMTGSINTSMHAVHVCPANAACSQILGTVLHCTQHALSHTAAMQVHRASARALCCVVHCVPQYLKLGIRLVPSLPR
jgi:hypothetical protein